MDRFLQTASSAIGHQLRPSMEKGPGKRSRPDQTPKAGLVDSYADSDSTTCSSSVVSSGRSSPLSTGTAASNLSFYLEDGEEVSVDDEAVPQLLCNFNPAFQKGLRGCPRWNRDRSSDADGVATGSISASDAGPKPEQPLPQRERSPKKHPPSILPLRSAYGLSVLDGPTSSASGPGSAPESRRGSPRIGQDRSGPKSGCITDQTETSETPKQELLDTASLPNWDHSGVNCKFEMPLRRRRVGQRQVEDICEVVLRKAFNVGLKHLTSAGEALESVGHCLEELSRVVHSDQSLEFATPFTSVPSGYHPVTQSADPGGGQDNGQTGHAQKNQGKRRASSRNGRDGEEGPGDGEDPDDSPSEDEDRSRSAARSKKVRVEPRDSRYPCPYRKRNPLRFNVRDHNTCATASFSDITNLKRHIKLYHRRQTSLPYVCFRCGVDQETRERLLAHVQLPQDRLCTVRQQAQTSEPEEGITQEVEGLLNERKSRAKIDTWAALWRALFGGDDDVLPPDFEPPVEWDEVRAEFDGTRDILRNRVQLESVTIKELRPEAQSYVATHMDGTCWDYINTVLAASRLQADYRSQKRHRRHRGQRWNAGTESSPGDGLLPPAVQRLLLPKPTSAISENGLPVGPNSALIVSNGSSLSSSWETEISNVSLSSSDLLSASVTTSLLTTQEEGEPQLPAQQKLPFLCLPGNAASQHTRIPWAGFVGAGVTGGGIDACGPCSRDQGNTDTVWHGAMATSGFPSCVQTMDLGDGEYALQDGLGSLFGYDREYDEGVGGCFRFEGNGTELDLGDTSLV